MDGRGRVIFTADDNFLGGVGVNGQRVAVVASRADIQLAGRTQADSQPCQMTTCRFGFNQALELPDTFRQ